MAFLLLIPATLGLGIGCGAFLLLALIPWQRSHALGSALWFALFGISVSATFWLEMVLLGLLSGPNVQRLIRVDDLYFDHAKLVIASILIASIGITSTATFLHHIAIRRITFRLFRLYASAVACGVGVLSSFFLGWIVAAETKATHPWRTIPVALLILPPLLTFIAYRHANNFRGARPERWNPITSEEYTSAP